MPLLSWGSLFETKITEIDNQHKKLVELLNQVHDAVQNKKGKEIMNKALTDLVSYTKTHFATEEKYMTQYNYPDLAKHKKEHEDLAKKVADFQQKYAKSSDDPLLVQELSIFLKSWLTNHIVGTDKKYAPFLISKGLK
ncbi:MAG: bacteriohemerythrin [Thermodesulfovibrionales bacterium]|nr:bacteriohemerythrin [Thermodesulfovibrionales bacterium]